MIMKCDARQASLPRRTLRPLGAQQYSCQRQLASSEHTRSKPPDVEHLRLHLCSNTEANRAVSANVTAALRAANPHTKCVSDVTPQAMRWAPHGTCSVHCTLLQSLGNQCHLHKRSHTSGAICCSWLQVQ